MKNSHHPANCIMVFLEVLSSRPSSWRYTYYPSQIYTFPNFHYTLYADDIELHSETTHSTELQLCMDTTHNWITSNHLQLNATKTELLNINDNSNLVNFLVLYIDSSPLTQSFTVNYLRTTFIWIPYIRL